MSNYMSVLQSLVIYIFCMFSIQLFLLLVTLSGRPGGYPDDDLVKFKKNKKTRALEMSILSLILCITRDSVDPIFSVSDGFFTPD